MTYLLYTDNAPTKRNSYTINKKLYYNSMLPVYWTILDNIPNIQ